MPLTAAEVAELKVHFAFLRQHKKTLRLRLNAQEDLLLNGAREPTDRGVCQHLLAKVELSRVAAVAERLDPAAATALVQGVVRFSHDVGFLLLYLDQVRRSSSQAEAAATLALGLKQIDFSALSAAQLRRVLDLVVEVFDDTARPQILLGLLASKSFRRALEESVATLPEPLARYITPLRAVQAALRGAPNSQGARALKQGIELLLGGTAKSLLRQPAIVRERLFELGLALFDGRSPEAQAGLDALLASLRGEPGRYRQLALERAGYWLAAERDDDARRLLTELSHQHPDWNPPRRWLEALGAPRVGRVALVGKPPRPPGDARPRRFRPGFWLYRQESVLVAVAEPHEATSFRQLTALWRGFYLPGLAPVLEAGDTSAAMPYVVVPQAGRPLSKRLSESSELGRAEAVSLARELARLLAMLSRIGMCLPDAAADRFAVDDTGRVTLYDLLGAEQRDSTVADRQHLVALRQLLGQIRRRAPAWVLSPELEQQFDQADHIGALGRALA